MKRNHHSQISRREFLKASAAGIAYFSVSPPPLTFGRENAPETRIALVKTQDRKEGVRKALELLDFEPVKDKKVFIKPNFNTADPPPASTHNDTLSQLILEMRSRGASAITVGERSGPPPTQKVLEDKGIVELSRELGFDIINFEDLPDEDWVKIDPPGNHWEGNLSLPRPTVEAEYFVSTCCLKTHQYGGVFTMSLKLAVGLTPKKHMRQLHSSPHMRKMIAEINTGYHPRLILMDGVDVFVDGGPSTGKKVAADVVMAGKDRIAVDAAGLAVLKSLGSNDEIMSRKIFDQEQIARAVELGLGIARPSQIQFVTPDSASGEYAARLSDILAGG